MTLVRNILIFLTLIGIAFALFNIQFLAKRKRVQSCDPHRVHALYVNRAGATPLALEEHHDKWIIRENTLEIPADPERARALATLMCSLPYVEHFDAAEELEAFGLASPESQLTAIGEDRHTLSIGHDTPAGTEFYLNTAHDPKRVYTVANSYKRHLSPALMDMRTHSPLQALDHGTVHIDFEERHFSFTSHDKHWRDSNAQLNPHDAEEIIGLLRRFAYKNYHGPLTEKETLQFGFYLPDLVIHWEERADEPSVEYRMSVNEGVYYLLEQLGDRKYVLILDPVAPRQVLEKLRSFL